MKTNWKDVACGAQWGYSTFRKPASNINLCVSC